MLGKHGEKQTYFQRRIEAAQKRTEALFPACKDHKLVVQGKIHGDGYDKFCPNCGVVASDFPNRSSEGIKTHKGCQWHPPRGKNDGK